MFKADGCVCRCLRPYPFWGLFGVQAPNRAPIPWLIPLPANSEVQEPSSELGPERGNSRKLSKESRVRVQSFCRFNTCACMCPCACSGSSVLVFKRLLRSQTHENPKPPDGFSRTKGRLPRSSPWGPPAKQRHQSESADTPRQRSDPRKSLSVICIQTCVCVYVMHAHTNIHVCNMCIYRYNVHR